MKSRKDFVKEAGVFLVVVLMTLSAVTVTANISNKESKTKTNALPSPLPPTPSVIFSDGFENWVSTTPFPPTGWIVYDEDQHPNKWVYSNTGARTEEGCALCLFDGMGNDDWLVTKQINVNTPGVFSFWINGSTQNPLWRDTFKVYNSSIGNTPTIFKDPVTGTLLKTENATNIYTQYSFTFSSAGPQWFAIRYNRSINHLATWLCLDDITFPDGSSAEGFESAPGSWTNWISTVGIYPKNKWEGIRSAIYPPATPHGGTWMAQYPSHILVPLSIARLSTKLPIDLHKFWYRHRNITFWMYHDTLSSKQDKVDVQLRISCPLLPNALWITIGTVLRNDGKTDWEYHSVTLPWYYRFFKVYIGFLGTSSTGNNMYIDDVAVNAYRR
jgi:hypothetical protein